MHNEPKQEKMSWSYAGDLLLTGAQKSLQGLQWAFNFKQRPTVAVAFLVATIGTAEIITQRPLVGEFLQLPQTMKDNEMTEAFCNGNGGEYIAKTLNF